MFWRNCLTHRRLCLKNSEIELKQIAPRRPSLCRRNSLFGLLDKTCCVPFRGNSSPFATCQPQSGAAILDREHPTSGLAICPRGEAAQIQRKPAVQHNSLRHFEEGLTTLKDSRTPWLPSNDFGAVVFEIDFSYLAHDTFHCTWRHSAVLVAAITADLSRKSTEPGHASDFFNLPGSRRTQRTSPARLRGVRGGHMR